MLEATALTCPAGLREVVMLGGSAGDDISLIYDVYELGCR